jgi:hypothetical protein
VFRTAGARSAAGCLRSRLPGCLPADCRPAAQRLGGSPRLCFAPQVRALPLAVCDLVYRAVCPRTAVLRLSGWAAAPGCDSHRRCARCRWLFAVSFAWRFARGLASCGSAVGRQPPAVIRTEGARSAAGCLQSRLPGRLPADCRPAAQRMGGSPRLCFATQVRALPLAVCSRVCLAVCPRTAVRRLSGWAAAPGCDSHRRCALCRWPFAVVFTRRFARGLPSCSSADGRQPPAVFRTAGARAAAGRLQSRLPGTLPADCRPAAQRLGGSPRLCFATLVRAADGRLQSRLPGTLPADCRPAAQRMGGSPRL